MTMSMLYGVPHLYAAKLDLQRGSFASCYDLHWAYLQSCNLVNACLCQSIESIVHVRGIIDALVPATSSDSNTTTPSPAMRQPVVPIAQ